MIILSIDTSTHSGSVAVTQHLQILSQKTFSGPPPFSQSFLGMVNDCLKGAEVSMEEISAFAVAKGPGSFTGLRLGISMATGFSIATGKPSVGVETLRAMALCVPKTDRWICPLLDARKNEIYGAVFKYDGDELKRIKADSAESLEDFLKRISEKALFFGNGAEIHGKLIKNSLKDKASFEAAKDCRSIAAAVGQLAYKRFKNEGEGGDAVIKPHYIRPCEAEVKRGVKIFNN